MPKFPQRKNDVLDLAIAVYNGLNTNSVDYPPAMFDATTLGTKTTAYLTAKNARVALDAQLTLAVQAENAAFNEVAELLKQLLAMAEAHMRFTPEKLAEIGWGPKADGVKAAPGQPRMLEAVIQGPGTVFLDWKPPAPSQSEGAVGFYRIERRIQDLHTQIITEDWGVWQATCTDSEITLTGQPRMMEIGYRIVAVNGNGDSVASNTELVVL